MRGFGGRGVACPVPTSAKEVSTAVEPQDDGAEEEKGEPNALKGAHAHSKQNKKAEVGAEATGDLSAYFGQQIPFNQLVALGALKKNSDGTYTAANGYTMGASLPSFSSPLSSRTHRSCSRSGADRVCVGARGQHGTTAATRPSCTTPRARSSSPTTTRGPADTRRSSRSRTAWLGASRGRSTRCVRLRIARGGKANIWCCRTMGTRSITPSGRTWASKLTSR